MHEAPSLRARLFARLVVPLLALLVVSAAVAYYAAFRFANQVYDSWISDTTVALSQLTHAGPQGYVLDLPAAAQHMLASDQRDATYYRVSDLNGGLVAGHQALPLPAHTPIAGVAPACEDAVLDGRPIRVASYRPPGLPVVVQVGETVTKRDVLAFEIIAGMLLPLLALVALGALGVWVGVDDGLRPLTRLAETLRDRSPLDLGPLPESTAPREVRPLVHALNELLGRVDAMVTSQRRFVADAAHQLRTPIAGIKTQSEMALRAQDRRTLEPLLHNVVAGTTRLATLVAQLLSLARVESDATRRAVDTPLDLDAVARAVTSDWIARALERRIDLGYEGPETPTIVLGDPTLMRELIGNLIDNTLKYCPPGSESTVSIRAVNGEAILAIEDNGPGIPEALRDRVFERFYRGPDVTEPGTGLGLSIVREFAREQGGRVVLGSGRDGRGTRVEVHFPVDDGKTRHA